DEGRDIAVDGSGNVYIAGNYRDTADFDPGPGKFESIAPRPNASSLTSNANFFVCQLDSNGNFGWAVGVGNLNDELTYSIAVEPFGQVYVTGTWIGTELDLNPANPANPMVWENAGSTDIFIAKYYRGVCAWSKSIGANSTESAEGIALDRVGNVYFTGGV